MLVWVVAALLLAVNAAPCDLTGRWVCSKNTPEGPWWHINISSVGQQVYKLVSDTPWGTGSLAVNGDNVVAHMGKSEATPGRIRGECDVIQYGSNTKYPWCREGIVPCVIPPARPTPSQLSWEELEIGALVCFGLPPFMKGQGCRAHQVPPPTLFNPKTVDTDSWARSLAAFGTRYAVLVAKHMCGFTLFPTNFTIPSKGFYGYNYTVSQSGYPHDILRMFINSCVKYGIKPGIYYSVNMNEYLNVQAPGVVRPPSTLKPGQVNVSQEVFEAITLSHVQEIWSQYGDLAELWFDGGFQKDFQTPLRNLIRRYQPNSVGFNGFGVSPNPTRWIGSESGTAPYPTWSTGDCTGEDGGKGGPGNPDSPDYCPPEIDFTLQNGDTWFFREGTGYISFEHLVGNYEKSVGHGGNMLLNLAVPPNGTVPPMAAKLYRRLGTYLAKCYGDGNRIGTTSGSGLIYSVAVGQMNSPVLLDRVVIQENITEGARIRGFVVEVEVGNTLRRNITVFTGTSVGNKLIGKFSSEVNVTGKLWLVVKSAVGVPSLKGLTLYGVEDCKVGGSPTVGCSLLHNYEYVGPILQTKVIPSLKECCQLCRSNSKCAVFVYSQDTCKLLTAQQGGRSQVGVVSGSPN